MPRTRVLIVSRSSTVADRFNQILSKHREFVVASHVIGNGHADPLHGVSEIPDLLLLHDGPGQEELRYLASNGLPGKLPLIVCGAGDNPESMRLAMQAGARDYLPGSAPDTDLVASLKRIQEEISLSRGGNAGKLVVVMNGKGGSGASFLATNLAHSLVVEDEGNVTLIDLDIQLGGLCRYLDIVPKMGILEALEATTHMDDVSAEAYTCEHSSGLRLLAAESNRFVPPEDVPIDKLDVLLDVFLSNNDYIVADCPNRLNSVTRLFLERADTILLIVQQLLPNVHDAARMHHLLTNEIRVPKSRIKVVLNRFAKKSEIEVGDIRKALRQDHLFVIPNHYKLAAESINSGVPVAELSRNGPISKAIRELRAAMFDDQQDKPADGFLARALPNILRS